MTLKVKWPHIAHNKDIWNNSIPLCNWINLDNGTMYRIISFPLHTTHGHPKNGLYVGIERKGSFLFDGIRFKSWDYVNEKLGIGNESDARILADWINAQCMEEFEQQGVYQKNYILSNDPCEYIGEIMTLPLVPQIVS
jgi:hypothetical protein